MEKQYPGTVLNYLDANFPFFDGFPLLPHLSHNDGNKLDLSFCYNDSRSNNFTNEVPSWSGYGVCEEPQSMETNTPVVCVAKGYWQYSLLKKLNPQNKKSDFIFNEQKTKSLILMITNEASIGKVFLEPHLKMRLGLESNKIRFHGCQAVRHDDHLHIQLN